MAQLEHTARTVNQFTSTLESWGSELSRNGGFKNHTELSINRSRRNDLEGQGKICMIAIDSFVEATRLQSMV